MNNQLYDETLSVHDDEEIASTFTPSPRPAKSRGLNQSGMVLQIKSLNLNDFSAFTFENGLYFYPHFFRVPSKSMKISFHLTIHTPNFDMPQSSLVQINLGACV